jgi:5,10-methylenetetrahydrofolate reductase
MAILTPEKRWQPAFFPFGKVSFGEKLLAFVERNIKGVLFGCRMCGNCVLQKTAFICPMQCPKGLRNGPCGGSTEVCYVDKNRICIWNKIYTRSVSMGRDEKLLEILAPLDWERVGKDTWSGLFRQMEKVGFKKIFLSLINKDSREKIIDELFFPLHHPKWWQSKEEIFPLLFSDPVSRLELKLRLGEFAVTAEVSPPLSLLDRSFFSNLETVRNSVDAVNFTDSPSSNSRMSSWACSKICMENGIEPVMQITARDRTRTGFQSDVMGASALGIRNLLCLSGDSMKMGKSPIGRMDISDLDSIQMLRILNKMRHEGNLLDERKIEFPPFFFLGAASSPSSSKPDFQAIRDQKKIEAGAQFFQTNIVFDIDILRRWLEALDKRKIIGKVFILVGITPLKSFKMAQFLNENVPGVSVPEAILKRMKEANDKGDSSKEGFSIALELVKEVKNLYKQGLVNGIHLMPVNWIEVIPEIIKKANFNRQGGTA